MENYLKETNTGEYYEEVNSIAVSFRTPLFKTPITPRENVMRILEHKKNPLWLPNILQDFNCVQPAPLIDSYARNYGGIGWFEVNWIMNNAVGAAHVDSNSYYLKDIAMWKEVVRWPEINETLWAADGAKTVERYSLDRMTFCVVLNGMLERLETLMGMEDALVSLLMEPEAVNEFFNALTDWYIRVFTLLRKYYRVDIVGFHDDWGTQHATMISEATLQKCILPHIERLVKATHDMGMFFDLHSCGLVEPFVPLMIEVGIDLWEGQQNNNKCMLKEKYGDRLAFIDNIIPLDRDDASSVEKAIYEYCESNVKDGCSIAKLITGKEELQMREQYLYSRRLCSELDRI